jgi:hypothetical protein
LAVPVPALGDHSSHERLRLRGPRMGAPLDGLAFRTARLRGAPEARASLGAPAGCASLRRLPRGLSVEAAILVSPFLFLLPLLLPL